MHQQLIEQQTQSVSTSNTSQTLQICRIQSLRIMNLESVPEARWNTEIARTWFTVKQFAQRVKFETRASTSMTAFA